MRRDAENLLHHLKQDNFSYCEYNYTFYTNSEWNIFSALQRDRRIFGEIVPKFAMAPEGNSASIHAAIASDAVIDGPSDSRPFASETRLDLRRFFTRFVESD